MKKKKQPNLERSTLKDPEEWVTGEEPMTGAQDSYLHTLARDTGEEVPQHMTKAQASRKIEKLQEKTGRGVNTPKAPRRKPSSGRKKS